MECTKEGIKKRIIIRLVRWRKWGGSHTENIIGGLPSHLKGSKATKQAIKKMAKKYGCIIVVKGKEDYVASDTQFKINKTGNVGMTKGGTGDVLAGLIASFACQNDLFISATAGVFINGLAGDRLKKKVSSYYNASDLIKEIPKTIKFCEDF